ncbi:hypothetical protein, partial [Rhizocola hellebori]|uniref:hypothetical protein n=1 Tax=Rhizocola hellebori TaxID=1392758 RepID=UPI0019432BAA
MTDQPRHPQDRDEQLPLFDATPGSYEPTPAPSPDAETTEQLPLFASSWDSTPEPPAAPAIPPTNPWDAEPPTERLATAAAREDEGWQ